MPSLSQSLWLVKLTVKTYVRFSLTSTSASESTITTRVAFPWRMFTALSEDGGRTWPVQELLTDGKRREMNGNEWTNPTRAEGYLTAVQTRMASSYISSGIHLSLQSRVAQATKCGDRRNQGCELNCWRLDRAPCGRDVVHTVVRRAYKWFRLMANSSPPFQDMRMLSVVCALAWTARASSPLLMPTPPGSGMRLLVNSSPPFCCMTAQSTARGV